MFWMITNRNQQTNGFGDEPVALSYWINDGGKIDILSSWKQLTNEEFRTALAGATEKFPSPLTTANEDQSHVTFFVHGYNERWDDAARLYEIIVANLYTGKDSLGECVLFTWPSEGSPLGYLPDRAEARASADALADVLSELYDWMSVAQRQTKSDPNKACKAKVSLIAHSMGNYVLQGAMNAAWTRHNRPLLVSLTNQLLMVAADVDNDLFRSGEDVEHGDGEGIANLTYRVTALFSGRDSVLGVSAGLKHFGKRRLGRSGIDRTYPIPDNVWDVDCSSLIPESTGGMQVHSAYFHSDKCYELIRQILKGLDRSILIAKGVVPNALAREQVVGS